MAKFRKYREASPQRGFVFMFIDSPSAEDLVKITAIMNERWSDEYTAINDESVYYDNGYCRSWIIHSYNVDCFNEDYRKAKAQINSK